MLRAAILSHTRAVSVAVEAATSPDQVKLALQSALRTYMTKDANVDSESNNTSRPVPSELLELERKVHKAVEEEQLSQEAVKDVFYTEHFSCFADILLSVVAADWLGSFSLQDKVQLFHAFFAAAPAAMLLPTLVTHLSSVAPLHEAVSAAEDSVFVTAVAADTAAAILAERFALPASAGVQELADWCGAGTAGANKTSVERDTPVAYLASLLASVPERAASVRLPALSAAAYIPQVIRQCVTVVSQQQVTDPSAPLSSSAAHAPEEAAKPGAESKAGSSQNRPFVGEVLSRLCRRGHSPLVAAALWAELAAARPGAAGAATPRETAAAAQHGVSGESPADLAEDRRGSHAAASSSNLRSAAPQRSLPRRPAKSSFSFPQRKRQTQKQGEQETEQLKARGLQEVAALAAVRAAIEAVEDATALERLLEALLREAARQQQQEAGDNQQEAAEQVVDPEEPAHEEQAARTLLGILQGPVLARPEARFFLEDKALLRRTLPPRQLRLLIRVLASMDTPTGDISAATPLSPLQQAAARLAQAWAHEEGTQRLPVRQQAYMSAALEAAIARLGKEGLEGTPGLFAALLTGVSTRLNSPRPPIRRQGMRVGQAFSRVLDPSKAPLFSDLGDLCLLPEEAWHRDCLPKAGSTPGTPTKPPQTLTAEPAREARAVAANGGEGYDSDESLEPYDLFEEEDDGLSEGDNPLQLRDVAALLRKGDDHAAVLKGLAAAGPLLAAAPHELDSYAGELVRALLHARPPEWADEEAAAAGRPEAAPAARRLAAMIALAATSPRAGGLALAGEVYSPHIDVHQRLTLLEALSDAARRLAAGGPQAMPAPDATKGDNLAIAEAEAKPVGNSRVWGVRALAKQKQPPLRTHCNRFVEVAAEWSGALLGGCDEERHGVDLFGRDALILGRLITTLGTFVECAAPGAVVLRLATALLELLAAPQVHKHPEPFVRRSALIAASQVVAAMPPAGLAGLLGGGASPREGMLAERLEWVREWAEAAHAGDADAQCRALACACRGLQATLAEEAMQALELGADGGMRQALRQAPHIILPPSSFSI